jgi:hypothetical protein
MSALVNPEPGMERREEFCEGLMVTQDNRRRRKTGGLPPLVAVMLFLTSTTGNALAADDKACSQQERTNKTLSEKLDQTAGVICPPEIDPAIKAPTPNAGKTPVIPPPGSPGGDPSSLSDPCDRGTASQVSIDAIWKSDKVSLAVLRKALSWTGDASAAVSGASTCEASGWCAPRLTGTGSWLR